MKVSVGQLIHLQVCVKITDRVLCVSADINECLLGAHHCQPGERCINTLGSYRCQREVSCGTGYELTDSNKCEGQTHTHGLGLQRLGMLCDFKNVFVIYISIWL